MSTVFPNGIDTFDPKVDEDVPQEELHVVPSISPFQVQLAQRPKGPSRGVNGVIESSTVYVLSMKEVEGTPQSKGQYNVDYNTGILTFHPDNKGANVTVQYKTAGDPITAEDFNTIQEAVVALETFCLNPYLKDVNNVKWYLKVNPDGSLYTSNQP